jgi:hypothetical protein
MEITSQDCQCCNGSFAFVKIVSETVSDSDSGNMKQYLPWPPWLMRQKIETIQSVLCHLRWPMQVLFHVAVAVIVASVIA